MPSNFLPFESYKGHSILPFTRTISINKIEMPDVAQLHQNWIRCRYIERVAKGIRE